MRLDQLLEESARRSADSTAIIEVTRTITYGALDTLANRFGRMFREAGVRPADRVVIALENSIDQVAAYFGVMKAGGVAVPLPAGPRSDRLGVAIKDCAPRACLLDAPTIAGLGADSPVHGVRVVLSSGQAAARRTGSHAVDDVTAALARTADHGSLHTGDDSDLAAIIYTSGSTGEPRGVMLSHRNFVSNARAIVDYLQLTASDRAMCVLPFYYVYGLSVLHSHMAVGGSVIIDNRFAFPNVVLDSMRAHSATGFAGVPSTFALLLRRSNLADLSLPTLRYVTQAGGNMPPAKVLEWLERGPRAEFFVMYGATEAAARLTYVPPHVLRRKLGSIGIPIPSVSIVIRRDDGSLAEPGEVGELVASGPNIAAGYWNRPDESAARFGPQGYRTGDLGYMDEDGFLFLVGRLHDMIKVGAHRVGAKEIEDVLHTHHEVVEAAVVGAPDDLQGEVPIAFVSLASPLADAERQLQAHCAGRLAAHKVPVRIVIQPELPKLIGTGKIDKSVLRERVTSTRPLVRPGP